LGASRFDSFDEDEQRDEADLLVVSDGRGVLCCGGFMAR
jgi:hypothetical protein